jgi:hypothetical protein
VTRPLIQIDDEIREMTDEELEWYETLLAGFEPLPSTE